MKRVLLSMVLCLVFCINVNAAIEDGVLVVHCFDDLIDSTGNGHNAILGGDAYISGGYLYLDGNGDYADIGPSTFGPVNPLEDALSDFTIAIAYVCTSTATGDGGNMLVSIGPASASQSGDFSLGTNNDGQYIDHWWVGAVSSSQSGVGYANGSIHLAIVTYKASTDTYTFYHQTGSGGVSHGGGSLEWSERWNEALNYTPRLGAARNSQLRDEEPATFFPDMAGQIDFFAMWDRVLTPSEMEYVEDLCGPPPADEEPPMPNPSTWAVKPHATAANEISMAATTASDRTTPVEYYFEETSGARGGSDSGWTTLSAYTDENLVQGWEYTYRVRTRDSHDPPHVGDWSTSESAVADDPLKNLDFEEILFIQRLSFNNDHFYTEFINYNPGDNFFRSDNGIYRYNLVTKTVTPVITAADMPGSGQGIFYKFDLDWDASRIVFDYKNAVGQGYRIWMCDIDGLNLTQITTTPPDEAANQAEYDMGMYTYDFHYDDMHPCFTQEDTIIFTSTRCKYTTLCDYDGVLTTPVLHRINLDGTGLEKLTDSPVSEFAPSMMEDGRVVYTRWEYVDKDSLYCKVGMSMKPDGTTPQEVFGLDQHSPPTVNYFRQIPGSPNKFICVGAPHYWQGDNLGPILLIDTNKEVRTHENPGSPDTGPAVTYVTPNVHIWQEPGWNFWTGSSWVEDNSGTTGKLYATPYPVNENEFLVTYKPAGVSWEQRDAYNIELVNTDGSHLNIISRSGTSCWHPIPLKSRQKPKIPATKIDQDLADANLAECIVTDVHKGMEGINPGDVAYLRVNIAVSRPWSCHRINLWEHEGEILSSTGWASALWPRVQLGIVTVEADGSAYFVVPADRNIFLQALDSEYRELQRERTYFNMRPGEVRACIGCHEKTGQAAPIQTSHPFPLALEDDPCTPAPMPGETAGTGRWAGWGTKVLYYPYDIQPILNDNCISCHDSGGQWPNLTGGVTEHYTVSYESFMNNEMCGPLVFENNDHMSIDWTEMKPPKFFGCYSSSLADHLYNDQDHRDRLTDEELWKIFRWIDTNYQFYGTYYGRHHSDHSSDPDFRRMPTVEEALSNEAPSWHN